jgi:hypothetical protein
MALSYWPSEYGPTSWWWPDGSWPVMEELVAHAPAILFDSPARSLLFVVQKKNSTFLSPTQGLTIQDNAIEQIIELQVD